MTMDAKEIWSKRTNLGSWVGADVELTNGIKTSLLSDDEWVIPEPCLVSNAGSSDLFRITACGRRAAVATASSYVTLDAGLPPVTRKYTVAQK